MKCKKSIIMIILAIFLITIAAASAGDVNDSTISSEDTLEIELTHDSGIEENSVAGESEDQKLTTDYTVDGDDFESIQTKINQASDGDRIFLGGKNYTGTGQGIVVDKSLTIIGGSFENDNTYATLDARQLSKIMWINADNVVLKGIIFINGYAKEDYDTYGSSFGGAIFTEKNNVSVVNCNFTGNHADASGGAVHFKSTGTVTNCNFTDNQAPNGGAVHFESTGTVTNCNFTDNHAEGNGGAVHFESTGTVTNCNFTDNQAANGGAVHFKSTSTVTNCNFTVNSANYGGAVHFESTGTVTNCNFTDNHANYKGGAVRFKSTGTVTNCNFANNSALGGGAILSNDKYSTADTCIFKTTSDTTDNTNILPPTLNVDNFTTFYGSCVKFAFDLKTNSGIPVTNGNISISLYFKDNNSWIGNYSCLSGEGWTVDLPIGSYYAIFDTEYAGFKLINRTITVTKLKTELFADAMTVIYNTNRNLTVTLKDEKGNPVAGVCLSVDLNGAEEYITDQNGQVKVNVGKLTPKTYNVKIAFGGNANYLASSADVKLTVKKATPKIIAKKKTYKAAKKTKKYTVVLKSGKTPIKKAKMALKIKGKTYKAKTNAKGKATFKIKLTKKSKYKATIKYKGNKYFKAVTKKVKITIK